MPWRDVAFAQFGQIEAGGEMLAFAEQQHGADPFGQRGEELLYSDDCFVVERVAFMRPVEPQNGDGAIPFGDER